MSNTETIKPAAGETPFQAEVARILELMVHSVYSDRDIFLRELISNASDALDKRRFLALTDGALAAADGTYQISLTPNITERTLTIADNGVGMDAAELAGHLGTIARSGTKAFLDAMAEKKEGARLIGRFGVGFYSVFMVADRVEVTSRKAGSDAAFTWASDGRGTFTMAPAERENPGTTITLHMKTDAEEYLEPSRLETVVRKWADHVTIPVLIAHDGQEQAANEGTALWRKNRAELSEDDYQSFYRSIGLYFDTPAATIHWRAEGMAEFHALLFIPGMKPFEPGGEQERVSRLRLHVTRMFITDRAELLPPWLRFVQGVVDTEDLPLNVSREMLQATPVLARIRRAVTNRVITELKSQAKDAGAYAKIWDNFGAVIKEGAWDDAEHRTEIAALLRFASSAQDGLVSLAEYVARMKDGQEAIYYLAGDGLDALRGSAQLEGLRARGVEVLLMADPIDAFWPDRLDEFEAKKLRSVTQGADDLGKIAPLEAPSGDVTDTEALVAALKTALGDAVGDVRPTDRLVDSAVVLAAGGAGADLQMQRLLRRAGRSGMTSAPVLEINPRHPLVAALAAEVARGADIAASAELLLDLARIQDGEAPRDPAAFARTVEARLTTALAHA